MKLTRREFLKLGGAAALSVSLPCRIEAQPLRQVPVLLYRDISDNFRDEFTVRPSLFAAQMEWLYGNGYHVVSLRQMLQDHEPVNEKTVVLTFDGAYASFLDYAYYLLQGYGFRSTVNLPGKKAGRFVDFNGKRPVLSWDECRFLQRGGQVDIGSLSYNLHSNGPATLLPVREIEDDLLIFQEIARGETGKRLDILAWPTKNSSDYNLELARRAGFMYVLSQKPQYYRLGESPFGIPRFTVYQETTMTQFRKIVEGAL